MNLRKNRGIALPIIFGLILSLGIWVGSLSWTMTHSRSRFQQTIKVRRAYFMARSALQHFFLKMKILQARYPQAFQSLTTIPADQWPVFSKAFVTDILAPTEGTDSYAAQYRITSFTLEKLQGETEGTAVKIVAEGEADGATDAITRTQRMTP